MRAPVSFWLRYLLFRLIVMAFNIAMSVGLVCVVCLIIMVSWTVVGHKHSWPAWLPLLVALPASVFLLRPFSTGMRDWVMRKEKKFKDERRDA